MPHPQFHLNRERFHFELHTKEIGHAQLASIVFADNNFSVNVKRLISDIRLTVAIVSNIHTQYTLAERNFVFYWPSGTLLNSSTSCGVVRDAWPICDISFVPRNFELFAGRFFLQTIPFIALCDAKVRLYSGTECRGKLTRFIDDCFSLTKTGKTFLWIARINRTQGQWFCFETPIPRYFKDEIGDEYRWMMITLVMQ